MPVFSLYVYYMLLSLYDPIPRPPLCIVIFVYGKFVYVIIYVTVLNDHKLLKVL